MIGRVTYKDAQEHSLRNLNSDMDFDYQNPSRKVVPKMWSAEWGKKRKKMGRTKNRSKKDINTNGNKIQINIKI